MAKEFQRQLDEDPDLDEYFVEEFPPFIGGVYETVEDFDSPLEAAKEALRWYLDQETDGDSNFGIYWRKIENFVE